MQKLKIRKKKRNKRRRNPKVGELWALDTPHWGLELGVVHCDHIVVLLDMGQRNSYRWMSLSLPWTYIGRL